MTKGLGIRIRPDQRGEYITSLLSQVESHRAEPPQVYKWTFFDTYDWRLYNRSMTLLAHTGTLSLRDLNTGEILHRTNFQELPVFASLLPGSTFKEALQSIIDIRALLLITTIQVHLHRYRVLNRDQKTVAYLNDIQIFPGVGITPERSDAFISVDPVRGYDKPHLSLSDHISKIGTPIPLYKTIYSGALKKARLTPGSYTNQLNLELDPGMSTLEAMRLIYSRLLEIIKANEAGIKADIDTEFLHDFRVAIRKTRSGLGQVKGILPGELSIKYRDGFSTYGKFTNQLRDLDVYLLSESVYRQMLPETMQEHLNPLFQYLRTLRVDVHRQVVQTLNSDDYNYFFKEWQTTLQNLQLHANSEAAASKPILVLAKRRILKQFTRIRDLENLLEEDVEDTELHRLRIECKKLRYLLEFFNCLFPNEKISLCIRQLKKLQDHLGEFNDLVIQQEYLLGISRAMPIEDEYSRLALVATGYLVDRLGQRQMQVRSEFGTVFSEFLSKKNTSLYQSLFT